MQKNSLWRKGGRILRIIDLKEERLFVIDCIKRTIPKWVDKSELEEFVQVAEEELLSVTKMEISEFEALDDKSICIVNARYTMIAGVLSVVTDFHKRNQMMAEVARVNSVHKQTIRNYLCLYLVYQNKSVLAPKVGGSESQLSKDQKNMRWALNKFFYTTKKNSLRTAYTAMLKEKYCNASGELLSDYPSFYQFQYFYRKKRKLQNYYISRNGLKYYQRNKRPLLGDRVQEFAPAVGTGMLDATVCDVYLINESGQLVGRPILTACVDAYSGLCCGYSLTWEGGVYSLRKLMLNVIADKREWCRSYGINIREEEWDCKQIPGILVTDMGSEYKSENFEQIAELGIKIINLPAYRPELKGVVEKFFDVIQNLYKPYLQGRGVIELDFQERGAHDYRKDACVTLQQFEKIILYCIVYYNSQRVVEHHPYTEEMLQRGVQPYASSIWNDGRKQLGANLIQVNATKLIYTMLPRTEGRFTRSGLKVNGLRYKNNSYTERYLSGGTVMTAYNPDDVTMIWLHEDGAFVPFELIDT